MLFSFSRWCDHISNGENVKRSSFCSILRRRLPTWAFLWRVGGIQFNYLKNCFEERLSSSDSYKLGTQGKLSPHAQRRAVCLGHNKGSEE